MLPASRYQMHPGFECVDEIVYYRVRLDFMVRIMTCVNEHFGPRLLD